MAIKQPTPPTPPTPPVSPKGDTATQASGATDNSSTGHNTEAGSRDFGVHITISAPEDKTGKQQTNNGKENAVQQQGDSGTAKQGEENTATPQPVQMQGNPNTQTLTTEVQDDGQKIHIANNNTPFDNISIWPFVLIFITAFLAFSFMNMQKRKNNQSSTLPKDMSKERQNEAISLNNNNGKSKGNDDDDDNIHGHFEVRI